MWYAIFNGQLTPDFNLFRVHYTALLRYVCATLTTENLFVLLHNIHAEKTQVNERTGIRRRSIHCSNSYTNRLEIGNVGFSSITTKFYVNF